MPQPCLLHVHALFHPHLHACNRCTSCPAGKICLRSMPSNLDERSSDALLKVKPLPLLLLFCQHWTKCLDSSCMVMPIDAGAMSVECLIPWLSSVFSTK